MKEKINWTWFNKYFKSIAIIIGVIFLITKIDLWVNGSEESTFFTAISPLIKSLIGDFLIVLFILLIVVLYRDYKTG